MNDFPSVVVSALGVSFGFDTSSTICSTLFFASSIVASISGFDFSTASMIFCPSMNPCSLSVCVNDFPSELG